MLELHESHGMEHDRGHVVLARLVVVVLACPETLGVAHERREREGPVVASLPVTILILLGALAVDLGHLPERDDRDQVEARLLAPLLPVRVGRYANLTLACRPILDVKLAPVVAHRSSRSKDWTPVSSFTRTVSAITVSVTDGTGPSSTVMLPRSMNHGKNLPSKTTSFFSKSISTFGACWWSNMLMLPRSRSRPSYQVPWRCAVRDGRPWRTPNRRACRWSHSRTALGCRGEGSLPTTSPGRCHGLPD